MVEDISNPLKVMRRESIRIGRKYRRFTIASTAAHYAVSGVILLINGGILKVLSDLASEGESMRGGTELFTGMYIMLGIPGTAAIIYQSSEHFYEREHEEVHSEMSNLREAISFLRKVEEGKIHAASGYKGRIFEIANVGNKLVHEFKDWTRWANEVRKKAEQNLGLINKQFHERRIKISHEIQRLKKVPGKESDKKIKELKKGLWKLVKNHMKIQKQLEKTEKKMKAVTDRVDDMQNSLNLIARMNRRLMAGMNRPVKGNSQSI